MRELDPLQIASLEDLASCLRQVHLHADKPTYRSLELQTMHAKGLLPGTRLKPVRLTRSTLSDVLLGRRFPSKSFMLSFLDACGVDLANDDRWGAAWDRLAAEFLGGDGEPKAEGHQRQIDVLREQLAIAESRAQIAEYRVTRVAPPWPVEVIEWLVEDDDFSQEGQLLAVVKGDNGRIVIRPSSQGRSEINKEIPAVRETTLSSAITAARSIASGRARVVALAEVAGILISSNPGQADLLLAEAEQTASSIADKRPREEAFAELIKAIASRDPDRALWLAESITDVRLRASAFAELARKVAYHDPDRALRLAESITDAELRASALVHIAKAEAQMWR